MRASTRNPLPFVTPRRVRVKTPNPVYQYRESVHSACDKDTKRGFVSLYLPVPTLSQVAPLVGHKPHGDDFYQRLKNEHPQEKDVGEHHLQTAGVDKGNKWHYTNGRRMAGVWSTQVTWFGIRAALHILLPTTARILELFSLCELGVCLHLIRNTSTPQWRDSQCTLSL